MYKRTERTDASAHFRAHIRASKCSLAQPCKRAWRTHIAHTRSDSHMRTNTRPRPRRTPRVRPRLNPREHVPAHAGAHARQCTRPRARAHARTRTRACAHAQSARAPTRNPPPPSFVCVRRRVVSVLRSQRERGAASVAAPRGCEWRRRVLRRLRLGAARAAGARGARQG
eukprot:3707647-Pleurochrysis_carterae.AAC.1